MCHELNGYEYGFIWFGFFCLLGWFVFFFFFQREGVHVAYS